MGQPDVGDLVLVSISHNIWAVVTRTVRSHLRSMNVYDVVTFDPQFLDFRHYPSNMFDDSDDVFRRLIKRQR